MNLLGERKETDKKKMSPSIFHQWNLMKYSRWEEGNWKVVVDDGKDLLLIIKDLQLFVVKGDTALESVSLTQSTDNICSVYNNGTLVLAVKYQDRSTKFRVLFKLLLDGEKCVVELRKFIKVHIAEGSRPIVNKTQQPLSVLMAKMLTTRDRSFPVPECIPSDYPLESAIRLCILDPGFPAFVDKIESTFKKLMRDSQNKDE